MNADGDQSLPVRLGWRYAPAASDPGPAPARPPSVPLDRLEPGWIAAQRKISRATTRPERLGIVACALAAGLLASAWLAGLASPLLAGTGALLAVGGAAECASATARARRRLATAFATERSRVSAAAAAQARSVTAGQRDHAASYRAWQRRMAVFEQQPAWFGVSAPPGIGRLDIAGGTLAGWSALVTTIAVPLLGAGGEVTVIDLTEGAVASELVTVTRRGDIRPLVCVLPEDLPALDLGAGLDPGEHADVLALAVAAETRHGAAAAGSQACGPQAADHAADCALLERVLGVLPPDPPMSSLTAALRALAQVGDPRTDMRAGLITAEQLTRLGLLFGRGASERLVLERAFVLESRLRKLDRLGTGHVLVPKTRLRIAALGQRSGVIGNRMLATYLVAAMTQLLRQEPPGVPWAHTLFLLGAEQLAADMIDRLANACEISGAGLVLAFKSMTASARERIGRGNAAAGFMRLGNGDEARAASELIGTEHRFVVGQLTDTVGASVSDAWAGSYTSTAGTADSAAYSLSVSQSRARSRGRGRGRLGGAGPFGDFNRSSTLEASHSAGQSESLSLSAGITSGTSWGMSLSRTLSDSASAGRTVQRSRELLVEPGELQRLPATAMIVSYPSPSCRAVMLTDINPALAALGVADSESCDVPSAKSTSSVPSHSAATPWRSSSTPAG